MLKEAGEKLGAVLEETEIHDIRIPYLANVTADYVADKEQVKPLLMQQIASPVRWQQSVERMIADGVDNFVEIGPGKTLSGLFNSICAQSQHCCHSSALGNCLLHIHSPFSHHSKCVFLAHYPGCYQRPVLSKA